MKQRVAYEGRSITVCVEEVDLPSVGRGELHVVPVLHSDPERLATALEELATPRQQRSSTPAESIRCCRALRRGSRLSAMVPPLRPMRDCS